MKGAAAHMLNHYLIQLGDPILVIDGGPGGWTLSHPTFIGECCIVDRCSWSNPFNNSSCCYVDARWVDFSTSACIRLNVLRLT